ncbi:MAG: radical SAM protein, partial [Lentisphaeria bacterium]|nr:radical SAM protein [Lentisphaeria bacterium]
METQGRIHSFESFGTLDGPGIRFVIFFQGCPLRCKYCHNPDTWSVGGGREITVREIVAQVDSCRNFLRTGGVTLSGGEPLMQPRFAQALLNACRERGFHTALDTAGSLPLEQSRPVIDAADLLLLDIKALDRT